MRAFSSRFQWLYNTLVYMSLFGALGGLLGFGFGEIMNFRPNQRLEFERLRQGYNEMVAVVERNPNDPYAAAGLKEVVRSGRRNEYFAAYTDASISQSDRDAKMAEIAGRDRCRHVGVGGEVPVLVERQVRVLHVGWHDRVAPFV